MSTHQIYYYRDFMEKDFPFKVDFRIETNLNQQAHAHEHVQICYVMRGTCVHYTDNQTYMMTKGDMLAIPPYVPHYFEPYKEEKVELVQIDFMPLIIDETETGSESSLSNQYFPKIQISSQTQDVVEGLISSMRRENEQKQSGYHYLIKADLIRLLVTIFREATKEGPSTRLKDSTGRRLFHEAVSYIDVHYAENLQLEDVAQRAAMSPTYFSYMFKVLKGLPFVQYVNDVRIRKAIDLLRMTEMSVLDICFETGFNNASHFNRMFKKVTGMTPLKYRQQSEAHS
ncbi:AraC family transcriptional regulator [Paenibacillus qinlingensis]|uniref:AraC family transcriptional regulator n=1 Tax=Paenibacillus qinlingensis TaxID=1837343 RepID=UPI001565DDF6|nr:AraC family transcriptional regulator [Paenibacillus qinlingensis]NQX58649.1 helix-turn-helix transcriptional regulator [Paenibacillus qinlingensis]